MDTDLINIFRHNNWANRTLVDACSSLSDDQLDAVDDAGGYGSIRDTLLHVVAAQTRYVQRLTGAELTQGEDAGFTSFDDLKASLEASGERLVELASADDLGKDLDLSFMGKRFRAKPWLVLLQAINHATEHRTQIKSLMSTMKVTPPELDGWSYGDAVGGIHEA